MVDPVPLEIEDANEDASAAGGGCCSWFGAKRRRSGTESKYAAPSGVPLSHGDSHAGFGASSVPVSAAAAAPPSISAARHTPIPKLAFINIDRASPRARIEEGTDEAALSFATRWNCAIDLLRRECGLLATRHTAAPLLAEWIQQQGFSPLMSTLTAYAAANQPAEETYRVYTPTPSNTRSILRQPTTQSTEESGLEGGQLLLDPHALLTRQMSDPSLTTSTPPATLRWTRRQTMRHQRESQEFIPSNLAEAGVLPPAMDTHSSVDRVELTRRSSMFEDVAEEGASAAAQLSLPLDLTTAQEMNQQEVAAAIAPPVLDPATFKSIDQFAHAIGTQLVLAHLPDLDTAARQETSSSTSSSAATRGAPRTTLTAVSPSDIATWIGALVALLKQLTSGVVAASKELRDTTTALFQQILPTVAPALKITMIEGVDALSIPLMLSHLSSIMSLTLPLLGYYRSARSQLSLGTPFLSLAVEGASLLPPQECIAMSCSSAIAKALLPSVVQSRAQCLRQVEDEMCKVVSQLSTATASSYRSASISLAVTTAALQRLCTMLQWLDRHHRYSRDDSSGSLLVRVYPFLLHSLLDLFWTKLSVGHVLEGDESSMAQLWISWYEAVGLISQSWAVMCEGALDGEGEPPHIFRALREPIVFQATPHSSTITVPSVCQLLVSSLALLFDPLSHPLELQTSSTSRRTIPRCQLAVVVALKSVGKMVASANFLRWQEDQPADETSLVERASSPLLALSWFWDSLLPLFTPVRGCAFLFLADSTAAAAEMDNDDTENCGDGLIELELCHFLRELVFAPPPARPYLCPWLMDDTFTAAYLQLHYAALCTAYHTPSFDVQTEQLAMAHADVLRTAASLPSTVALRSISASPSVHSVRLSHVQYQLYHMGVVAWLSGQMNLELEAGFDVANGPSNGVANLHDTNSNHQEQPPVAAEHEQAVSHRNSFNASQQQSKKKSRHGDGDDDEDGSESGSDFEDINFEDSYDDYPETYAPHPALTAVEPIAALKLAVAPGARHLNEHFGLGMDGQPLHPEAELEPLVVTETEPNADADVNVDEQEGSPRSGASGSGSDLGDDGWGDDSADDETPRFHGASVPFALPSLGMPDQPQDAPQEVHTPKAAVEVPSQFALGALDGSAAADAYAELRTRHLLYRSPQLHASLVDLLLTLCLDPASADGHALNPLYCTRFPLQATEEQQRAGDRMQRVNAEADLAASMSMDDSAATLHVTEALSPLALNVLYSLRRHLNHASNSYLCAELQRRHALAEDVSAARRLSVRRLMKLLFEQLFDTSAYVNRQQIGRGRFASVYSTSYVGSSARFALKQVEQPSTMHDQMLLVDLFTEISILECMRPQSAGQQARVLDVLDFGVGDGAIWIVMPLALSSLKGFKVHQLEQEASTADALIRSLLAALYLPATSDRVSSQLAKLTPSARRLLASLSLYNQVLHACGALERHQVVHFDIKADNFLVFGGKSDAPLHVALGDFGEAMFVSASTGSGEVDDASVVGGSRICRGTENIQSPEMLTLIRALDRHYEQHDRRRKHEADFASDVWSIGALFYEVCMHTYGTDGEDDGCGGVGLLFEEAAGLPLFLQITAPSLPLLSESKAATLALPAHLGSLLEPCESFLSFVLRRDRLQRPSLEQVCLKFRNTLSDILAAVLPTVPLEERTLEIEATTNNAQSSQAPSSSSRPTAAPTVPRCVCATTPSSWYGVPPSTFRCSHCALLGRQSGSTVVQLDTSLMRYATAGTTPIGVASHTDDGGKCPNASVAILGSSTICLHACASSSLSSLLDPVSTSFASSPSSLVVAYDASEALSSSSQVTLTHLAACASIFFLPVRSISAMTAEDVRIGDAAAESGERVARRMDLHRAAEFVARADSHPAVHLLADATHIVSLLAHLVACAPHSQIPTHTLDQDAMVRAARLQLLQAHNQHA